MIAAKVDDRCVSVCLKRDMEKGDGNHLLQESFLCNVLQSQGNKWNYDRYYKEIRQVRAMGEV